MAHFNLPEGFLLGSASAALQVEGGDRNNNWYDWCRKGHIKDGSDISRACDHYNRYREDIELMSSMGMRIYRMGVEWARIEPNRGVFDGEAIAHYRDELSALRERGIEPLLTLHHFGNPMWFEEMGGFTHPDAVDIFLEYVDTVVRALCDLCSEYITINEPNVYTLNGYFYGTWPPGHKSLSEYRRVLAAFTAAHVRSYGLIHAIRMERGYTDTRVSFALHARVFAPKSRKNPFHILSARLISELFQDAVTRSMLLGKCGAVIPRLPGVKRGLYCDFHALNYYSRSTVSGLSDGVAAGVPVNDLGWEIYPHGIVECAQTLCDLAELPVYVTENGACDNTDAYRARFIFDHLKEMTESGLPFVRYYHWSFTDNFEWLEGESGRFGLVHIDYETQERRIKKSGEFYAAMAAEGGVSDELYEKYCSAPYNVK